VVAAASGHLKSPEKVLAGDGDPPVIWLQGRGCSGCSLLRLNSVTVTTVDDLLLDMMDLKYHSTLIAAAGDLIFPQANGAHPHLTKLSAFHSARPPCFQGPKGRTVLEPRGL
jgi:Ni,Fe-hydrogenase I small subunit